MRTSKLPHISFQANYSYEILMDNEEETVIRTAICSIEDIWGEKCEDHPNEMECQIIKTFRKIICLFVS